MSGASNCSGKVGSDASKNMHESVDAGSWVMARRVDSARATTEFYATIEPRPTRRCREEGARREKKRGEAKKGLYGR